MSLVSNAVIKARQKLKSSSGNGYVSLESPIGLHSIQTSLQIFFLGVNSSSDLEFLEVRSNPGITISH